MGDRSELRLSDVRAMRAMAHPLRMRILGSLRIDGPATATMLARRLDTDSGRTSFHLRQLARYGFIEDAPDLGKGPRGRDRYWRASHASTSWDDLTDLGPEGADAVRAVERTAHTVWSQMLAQFLTEAGREEWTTPWTEAASSGDYPIRTTPDGLVALVRELREVITRHDLGADASHGSENVTVLLHAFPRRAKPRPHHGRRCGTTATSNCSGWGSCCQCWGARFPRWPTRCSCWP